MQAYAASRKRHRLDVIQCFIENLKRMVNNNKSCSTKTRATEASCPCAPHRPVNYGRRSIIKLGVLAALWSPLDSLAARKPKKMRPQPGDHLVFAFGDRAGQPIESNDIKLDAKPVEAYPKFIAENDAESVLRNRSRLNMVLLMRLLPETISRSMITGAPEGLVAYSAVCTHTGCTVEGWDAEKKHMICPCHGSKYDAANRANVLLGPAPKPLAILPLRVESGKIIVAGKFSRKVGYKRQ